MRTLRESLLGDIDKTMNDGDKQIKKFAAAEADIKYISDCINDFSSNAKPSKWYFWKSKLRPHATFATIFFKTSKLTKFFNLPGKHIFIRVTFDKYFKLWSINMIFSNANKTIIDSKRQQMERIGSIQGDILYSFEESNIPNNKESKFSFDEFVQKYLSPMFNDINSFEQYIVEPYEKGINLNKTTI